MKTLVIYIYMFLTHRVLVNMCISDLFNSICIVYECIYLSCVLCLGGKKEALRLHNW